LKFYCIRKISSTPQKASPESLNCHYDSKDSMHRFHIRVIVTRVTVAFQMDTITLKHLEIVLNYYLKFPCRAGKGNKQFLAELHLHYQDITHKAQCDNFVTPPSVLI